MCFIKGSNQGIIHYALLIHFSKNLVASLYKKTYLSGLILLFYLNTLNPDMPGETGTSVSNYLKGFFNVRKKCL